MQVAVIQSGLSDSRTKDILDIPPLSTVKTVIEMVNASASSLLILVNGKIADLERVLEDGDELQLILHLFGG